MARSHGSKVTRNPWVTVGLMAFCLAAVVLYMVRTRPAGWHPEGASVEAAPPAESGLARASRRLLGTEVTIQVADPAPARAQALIAAGFAEIQRLEALLGPRGERSEVARLNAAAGGDPVTVGADLLAVLQLSREVAEQSRGAFDPTWAALAPLWDLKARPPRIPSAEATTAAAARVDHHQLEVDEDAGTARLAAAGMAVGLGGVAKGYAVDRAVHAMRQAGATSLLVDAGGDLRVLGRKGDRPWRVGVQDPRAQGQLLGKIAMTGDEAVATSGDYERFVELDGVRHHHILDPRTGRPATGCRSVTVLAPTAARADALATALFVLGPAEGIKLVNRLPGVEALLVDGAGRLIMTEGLARRFERSSG